MPDADQGEDRRAEGGRGDPVTAVVLAVAVLLGYCAACDLMDAAIARWRGDR